MIAVRYQSLFRGFVNACAPSDDLASSSRLPGAPGSLREPDPAPGRPKARILEIRHVDLVIRRRAAPAGLRKLPRVLRVLRGRARARKPSEIERKSSPWSPQTFPGTQKSIEAPQARPGASGKKKVIYHELLSQGGVRGFEIRESAL